MTGITSVHRKFSVVVFISVFWITLPLKAEQAQNFEPAIERFIHSFALPVYGELRLNAGKLARSVEHLCRQSDGKALELAHASFKEVIKAWSVAEVIRFGPIRDKNRFERIFFWPDPRSRGLRQVQKQLAAFEKKPIRKSIEFFGKSVAIQGLPALEYLLFGSGSEALSTRSVSSVRCEYALSVSRNIHEISGELVQEWKSSNGISSLLTNSGVDNPIYRNKSEVMQEILKSASELLQLVSNSKIHSSLRRDRRHTKPRKAPFWRSNLTLLNLQVNAQAVARLHAEMQLSELLPEDEKGISKEFIFEAQQVDKTFSSLQLTTNNWAELVKSEGGYELLEYVQIPLDGVRRALSVYYPEQLGLKLGFNSLDGD